MTSLLLCFGLWTIAAFFCPNVFKFSNNFQDSHSLNFGVCVFVKAACKLLWPWMTYFNRLLFWMIQVTVSDRLILLYINLLFINLIFQSIDMELRALFSLMLPNCAFILVHTGMWMLSWQFRKAHSSQCVGWTLLSTGNWLDLQCILASWVMANQLADMTICGLVGVPRYLHSFIWALYSMPSDGWRRILIYYSIPSWLL